MSRTGTISRPPRRGPGASLPRGLGHRPGGEPRLPRPSRRARARGDPRPGGRHRARDPAQLRREQALELQAVARPRRSGLLLVAVLGALLLVPAAAGKETAPVYDEQGNLIGVPFVPQSPPPRLTEASALR